MGNAIDETSGYLRQHRFVLLLRDAGCDRSKRLPVQADPVRRRIIEESANPSKSIISANAITRGKGIFYYFLGLTSCRHRMDHQSGASRDSAVFSSITTRRAA
jgi:hypothetical protein